MCKKVPACSAQATMTSMPRAKYVIHKGYQGLGDRLQALSYTLEFARRTGRLLYVDWSDVQWGQGDPANGFGAYFEVCGDGVRMLRSLDEIPRGASVYPDAWKGRLAEPAGPWIHPDRAKLEVHLEQDRKEDVVVHTTVGFRRWSGDVLGSLLRPTEPVMAALRSKRMLLREPYACVHLRGTDRSGGAAPTATESCAALHAQLVGAKARHPDGIQVVVVSDDRAYVDAWTSLEPASHLATGVTTAVVCGAGEGTHTLGTRRLEASGITKGELLMDLLTDFFVFALSNERFANNEQSTFSAMAKVVATCSPFMALLRQRSKPCRIVVAD